MSDLVRVTVGRMMAEAEKRIEDGALLESDAFTTSDSGYLLRLLGFEILLKALVLLHTRNLGRSHSYLELFSELPTNVRERVLAAANGATGHGIGFQVDAVLLTLQSNFVKLRYPYEAYSDLTEDAYKELGDTWLQAGAPLEAATFVYHPEALYGLTHALRYELSEVLLPTPSQSRNGE